MKTVPVLLIILDGFGCRKESADNAIAQAAKPNWDRLWKNNPHTLIHASESEVGLPKGQMGNSEVGHLNIGAGRVVYQEFTRIDRAIESGYFYTTPALLNAVHLARDNGRTLHVLGLLSDGGVHSHESHFHALLDLAAREGLHKVGRRGGRGGRGAPPGGAGGGGRRRN